MRIGQIEVRPEAGLIGAARVKPRVMDVLVFLADRQGSVVSPTELLDAIWRTPIADHAVHKAIADLRKALGDNAQNPCFIRTVPRRGYCLIAEVVIPDSVETERQEVSLAVLPFSYDGPDRDPGHMSDGITEAVLETLARTEMLRVSPMHVVARFSSRACGPAEAGRVLRVANVLSGTVRQADRGLKVSVRLIRVADGTLLWAQEFQGTMPDVLAIEESIVAGVVGALKIEPARTRPTRPLDLGTDDIKAYEAYLLGRHELHKHTVRSIYNAIGYLEAAIELDPRFARAHGRLFECYWHLIQLARVPNRKQLVPVAERVLDRAVALGYEHPSPSVFLKDAMHPERTPTPRQNAERALSQISRCDSGWKHYEYHLLSNCLCEVGLFRASAAYEERYNALTGYQWGELPYRDTILSELWGALGRFDEIIELWTRSIELGGGPSSHAARSTALSRTGRHDVAAIDLDHVAKVWPHSFAQFYGLYWQGDLGAAQRAYDQLVHRDNLDPQIRFWSQFLMADLESGLETLAGFVADSNRAPRIRAVLRWMLPPDVVRTIESHPRFLQFLCARGLTEEWREELIERTNDVAQITGVVVRDE